MKKLTTVLLLLGFIAACKQDPKIGSNANDPDSLYQSTPYKGMPTLTNRYRAIIIPSDNPLTAEGVQLGRMLFYDPVLSADSTVSCASCHNPRFAFGDSSIVSKRVFGELTTRNTPPLINLGMNKKFFFDGRKTSIEDAVADALQGEQHFNYVYSKIKLENQQRYSTLFKKAFGRPGDVTEIKVNKAIAQFIRTLVSYNSKFDLYLRGEAALTTNEQQGFAIFNDNNKGDCFHCHADGPYLTFANQILFFANNALDSVNSVNDFKDKGLGAISLDANDNGRFKIPTLRNIMLTPPYMHDGRFGTIEDVIGHYSDSLKYSPNVDPLMQMFNQRGVHINQVEKNQLIDFLKTLTDTSFVNKPEFQNPF